jgi:hypothetical protein
VTKSSGLLWKLPGLTKGRIVDHKNIITKSRLFVSAYGFLRSFQHFLARA